MASKKTGSKVGAKRRSCPGVPTHQAGNSSKRVKKEKNYEDFPTIRQIIEENPHGRNAPEGQFLSYIVDLLDKMAKVYTLVLNRDKKTKTDAFERKWRTWTEDYAKFLTREGRNKLVAMKDKPQYTGASSEEVAKVIEEIDTELSKEPVKRALQRILSANASTIKEACDEMESAFEKCKEAKTEASEWGYRRCFRDVYERNQELIQQHESDDEWKRSLQKFKSEYLKMPGKRNEQLPRKGAKGFEEALRERYTGILKRMREIEYEFFTSEDTDFQYLHKEHNTLVEDKKQLNKHYKDELDELKKEKGLLPPGVSQENFDCLRDGFINFRKRRQTEEDASGCFAHFNKISKLEEETKKNPDKPKTELERLKPGLPAVIDTLLEKRAAFLGNKGNEDLVKLLSSMGMKKSTEADSTEAATSIVEWEFDPISGWAGQLGEWGVMEEDLIETPWFRFYQDADQQF